MGHKVYSLSRDQVRELCPSCADKMQLSRIKTLKLHADERGNILPDDESTLKLFAGFSQGLCDKFGADDGFFTRCEASMSKHTDAVDDSKSFCASLHKFCTGHWPAEKKHAEQMDEEDEDEDMSREEMLAKCKKDHPDWSDKQHEKYVDGMMEKMKTLASDAEADAFTVAEYANDIRGVEIFRTGTHNGDVYDTRDLDDMVAAFKDLDYRPAIKIGHTKDSPGAPAYGWVQNVARDGDKLKADFTDLHDSVVDAIRNKSYDRCSSEIYFNLKRGGKDYRRALKAVALLGAEVPAVANLVPLHKMEFTADGFERVGTLEQQLEVPAQSVVDALAERVAGLVTLIKEYDMAKNAEQIKALKAQIDEFNQKMEALKEKKADLTDEQLAQDAEYKELSAQADEISDKIAILEDADASDTETVDELRAKVEAAEASAAESQKQIKELSEQMASINRERRSAAVGAKVAACKIPAFRDALKAVYDYALEHSAATVKIYSADKDGKPITTDKTLVEVMDGVVSEINAQSEKLFKALAFTGQSVRADGVVDEDAGKEVQKRVTEYRTKHPEVKLYEVAMTAVLAEDSELAQRYRAQMGQEQ